MRGTWLTWSAARYPLPSDYPSHSSTYSKKIRTSTVLARLYRPTLFNANAHSSTFSSHPLPVIFRVHDRVHKSSPLDKILWRINPAASSHHSSLRFVLISSSNYAYVSVLEYSLCISRIKNLYAFRVSMHASCTAHFVPLGLTTL